MEGEGQAVRSEIPMAPQFPGLPESKQREWRELYAKALKQAKIDHPEDGMEQRAVATREANRIFRVDELRNYREAMALESWQVLHLQQMGDQLKVVTIDGKKYSFDVPRGVDASAKYTVSGKGAAIGAKKE